MKLLSIFLIIGILLVSCNNNDADNSVYNGRLDSDLVRISALATGTVDSVFVDQGQTVLKGQKLLVIDSDKIKAQLQQNMLQKQELESNLAALDVQAKELNIQLDFAETTLVKTEKMLKAGAATDQSRDELATQVDVLKAKKQSIGIQRNILNNKAQQLNTARELLLLTLKDTRVTAPTHGQIINRFSNVGELAIPGMALFEMADLSILEANIYIPLNALGSLKLGNAVTVKVDGQEKEFSGTVDWISSESEFTPKTILTEETRTTLVYRVKIKVQNPDGILKIGMPIDVYL